MIIRFLDTFFRHKLLILLPVILIPLIVGPIAVLRAPMYYEATVSVMVDRATYLSSTDQFNQYATPAQQQGGRLTELLRTQSFLMAIASRTALAPLTSTTAGQQVIINQFGRGFAMAPIGDRLLWMRFRSSNPQLAYQMVNAVMESFKEKITQDRLGQANLAITFFESRLVTADDEVAKANEALRRYLAANPRLTNIDPDRGAAATTASRLGLPANAIDPQMADLLRKVELQQADADRLRASLEQARLDTAAALQGQELGFQVVDPATMPERQIRERRKALIYPAGGLIVGLGLSTALLVLLVATDRSVRNEADLASIARVAGTVPQLRLARMPKTAGPDLTRRAIGYAAGTPLPAPAGAN